jgi:hypothetical protein
MATAAAERESMSAVARAQTRGDVATIIRELRCHPRCADVQMTGFQALAAMVTSRAAAMRDADAARALEAALHAFQSTEVSTRALEVQTDALQAAASLLSADTELAASQMAYDAIEPVVNALRAHESNAHIVQSASLALGAAALGREACGQKALDAGAPELMASALSMHHDDSLTLCAVLPTLGQFASV